MRSATSSTAALAPSLVHRSRTQDKTLLRRQEAAMSAYLIVLAERMMGIENVNVVSTGHRATPRHHLPAGAA
jgi:hypothetical protein